MVRFHVLAFASLLGCTAAFVPPTPSSFGTSPRGRNAALQAVAVEEPPLSPLTKWGDKISDIVSLQQKIRSDGLPEFAPAISAKDLGIQGDETAQLEYFQKNAMEIKNRMQANAAVVFRDFDLMKTQEGFQQFYSALGMKTCLDPLHSVSARPTIDGKKNSPVYEAVNKESRKNFFIGKRIENFGLGLTKIGMSEGLRQLESEILPRLRSSYSMSSSLLFRNAQ